jgi:hypothetical protein
LYERKGFRLIQSKAFSSHSKRCISPDAGENQLLGVFLSALCFRFGGEFMQEKLIGLRVEDAPQLRRKKNQTCRKENKRSGRLKITRRLYVEGESS